MGCVLGWALGSGVIRALCVIFAGVEDTGPFSGGRSVSAELTGVLSQLS